MATLTSGPNVYIDEIPSGVHTITGVATAIAAFVDFFPRGDMNVARRVFDFGEFTRIFGGLHPRSESSYAIQQFFQNGGGDAWVVRTASGAFAASSVEILDGIGGAATLRIEAINARGGDAFAEYQVPLAILALQQGLGRLIRHRTDRGVLAVLDPRLRTMGYGRRFLDSLPPAPVTHDLEAVGRFFM